MNRPRAGFSLLEMMVTMVAGSSLMLLAAQLIYQSMTMSKTSMQRVTTSTVVENMARQFRADVHLAQAVVAPIPQQLELQILDRQVTYACTAGKITRTLQASGADQDSPRLSFEAFLLPGECRGEFVVLDNGLVQFSLTQATGLHEPPQRTLRVISANPSSWNGPPTSSSGPAATDSPDKSDSQGANSPAAVDDESEVEVEPSRLSSEKGANL